MAGKIIPAAEARKRMEAAESKLSVYKTFLYQAGLNARALDQYITELLHKLDTLGEKIYLYKPPKADLFGHGDYESLLAKYVELLGEHETLKKAALQTPAPATEDLPAVTKYIELQKKYESLKADRDRLANALRAEQEKRAKAGRRPRIRPEVVKRILELHEQGLTQVAIAEAVGYSVFTINRVIHVDCRRGDNEPVPPLDLTN